MPILFEEIFRRQGDMSRPMVPVERLSSEGKIGEGHLLVFVHGYQGNSYDMHLMKDITFLRLDGCQSLCSVDNEDNTEGDIQTMGDRLAREVDNFVKEWFPGSSLRKLSLIGHSMGGVIIRAALPRLAEYREKMQTFLTLSSPHLGCLQQRSKLVGVGMWLMKKWNKSKSLEQLEMADDDDYTQTFMYKLSLSLVFVAHRNP